MFLLALLKRIQVFFFSFAFSAASLFLVSLAIADVQHETAEVRSGFALLDE